MIPRHLFCFWHDPEHLPPSVQAALHFSQLRTPNYSWCLADDALIQKLLTQHYPAALQKLYQANQIPASRSDLARLILLYHYGGIYIDASMELQEDPHNLLIGTAQHFVAVQRDDNPRYLKHPPLAHTVNSIFAAQRHHPALKMALYIAWANLASRHYNHRVWYASGAYCLNQALAYHPADARRSFRALKDRLFVYRRDLRSNNRWRQSQQQGILPPLA